MVDLLKDLFPALCVILAELFFVLFVFVEDIHVDERSFLGGTISEEEGVLVGESFHFGFLVCSAIRKGCFLMAFPHEVVPILLFLKK